KRQRVTEKRSAPAHEVRQEIHAASFPERSPIRKPLRRIQARGLLPFLLQYGQFPPRREGSGARKADPPRSAPEPAPRAPQYPETRSGGRETPPQPPHWRH